jgi:hypothetical protein
MATAAVKGQNITIQDAQTTGNGTALAIPPGIKRHTFYIRGNGAIGAGAIQLETASDPDYTGTWAALVNDLATATTNPVTVVGSAEVIYRIDGAFTALRARISTTITTTTVTVIYRGED